MSNGCEIQIDKKVSVLLMIKIRSQVHRDFLITLYKLINFCNYVFIQLVTMKVSLVFYVI